MDRSSTSFILPSCTRQDFGQGACTKNVIGGRLVWLTGLLGKEYKWIPTHEENIHSKKRVLIP